MAKRRQENAYYIILEKLSKKDLETWKKRSHESKKYVQNTYDFYARERSYQHVQIQEALLKNCTSFPLLNWQRIVAY